MVDFVRLQEIVKKQLEQDRAITFVEAVGPTLETAVSDAAALLDIPVRRVEYEITERGSTGFLGVGKRDWRIQGYERASSIKKKLEGEFFRDENAGPIQIIEDKDGDIFVHLQFGGDVLLKVTPPQGKGRKAYEAFAIQALHDRGATDIAPDLIAKTVREAAGVYVKVASFEHQPVNDSTASLEVPEGDMKALLMVLPPGEGGCDLSYDDYLTLFQNHRVVHGIKEDFLLNFIDRPIYREKVEVAEGSKPIDGKDAYIHYNFEIDQNRVKLRVSSNGRVDFKELNIIQNVVENEPLAKKIPFGDGTPGKTVRGQFIPAKSGKDTTLPLGKNVHADNEGAAILADMNGQVVVLEGLINVEPVYTVDGDVDLKTGNIIFLGTVIVNGSVEDGFSIKAAGNIEVTGTVSKAELEAEGDIVIHQGINGKGGGKIRAGRSLWARFIENANITAGNMVVASDEIINSQVDAESRVIVQGKRAHIMGGRIRATEEINAKLLGNATSSAETLLEVGYDPKSKEELVRLTRIKAAAEKELDEVNPNLQTLINLKKRQGSLSEDKEAYMQELMKKRQNLIGDLKKTEMEMAKVQNHFAQLNVRGKVSASSKVYPGIRIVIRDVSDEVRTEYKAVTFILENGLIQVTAYEEPNEEAKKGPDGYTAD